MSRIAWRFSTISATPETYDWPINPNAVTSPPLTKSFRFEVNSLDTFAVLEGNDEMSVISVSGVTYTQDEFEALNEWFDKQDPVLLTDDLGRTFEVYITRFAPRREPTREGKPWKHSYDMDILVLGET